VGCPNNPGTGVPLPPGSQSLVFATQGGVSGSNWMIFGGGGIFVPSVVFPPFVAPVVPPPVVILPPSPSPTPPPVTTPTPIVTPPPAVTPPPVVTPPPLVTSPPLVTAEPSSGSFAPQPFTLFSPTSPVRTPPNVRPDTAFLPLPQLGGSDFGAGDPNSIFGAGTQNYSGPGRNDIALPFNDLFGSPPPFQAGGIAPPDAAQVLAFLHSEAFPVDPDFTLATQGDQNGPGYQGFFVPPSLPGDGPIVIIVPATLGLDRPPGLASKPSLGGGIASAGGPLSIANSTISGNTAGASGASPPVSQGGGISSAGAPLSITNSTISGNQPTDGKPAVTVPPGVASGSAQAQGAGTTESDGAAIIRRQAGSIARRLLLGTPEERAQAQANLDEFGSPELKEAVKTLVTVNRFAAAQAQTDAGASATPDNRGFGGR